MKILINIAISYKKILDLEIITKQSLSQYKKAQNILFITYSIYLDCAYTYN